MPCQNWPLVRAPFAPQSGGAPSRCLRGTGIRNEGCAPRRSASRPSSGMAWRGSLVGAAVLAAWILMVPGAAPAYAQSVAQTTWNPRFYDPAGDADLVLPLPCGGAMAFQRVDTPVPADNPITDRAVQLGLGDTAAGYVDYLRRAYVRGGFNDETGGAAHYFIGRYELTSDQFAALRGECPSPSPRGAVPASGLSWFDAVDVARRMTEWLRAEAPGALPVEEGVPGFVRLPTEIEWEYAVRGGAAVDVSVFNQRTFVNEGEMRDYAWHQGASSARGSHRAHRPPAPEPDWPLRRVRRCGGIDARALPHERARPTPWAAGRCGHARGLHPDYACGVVQCPAERVPGVRNLVRPTGRLDTFGARFVIGVHVSVSTERTNRIRAAWLDRFQAAGDDAPGLGADLAEALDAVIAEEIERGRRARLEAVRLLATEERRERQANRLEALKASILGGAVIVWFLREDAARIESSEKAIAAVETAIQQASDGRGVDSAEKLEKYGTYLERLVEGVNQQRERFSLNFLSYERNLVTSATEYGASERSQALDVLLRELALTGRAALEPLAREFHGDITAYDANPGLPAAAIRGLALE